jgi:hypothetical protein
VFKHDEVFITLSAKAKFDGTKTETNVVPLKSRVTLSCRVELLNPEEHLHLFSLMLVSFTLPNGEQIVPGKCTVDYQTSSKRCKFSIKGASLSDQGMYRCHAQYLSGTDTKQASEDIFLREYSYC